MMVAGFWMRGEGYPPVELPLLSVVLLYAVGQGLPLIKDYMRGTFRVTLL